MRQFFKKILSQIFAFLLICSHLFFSYYYFNGWWNSSFGTLLILIFSYLIWKDNFLEYTGLKVNFKIILKSFSLACCLTILSYFIINHLANQNNIFIKINNWKSYYHDLFYTFNEEIIIGAILIKLATKKYKIHPVKVSILLSVIFSILHYIFFKWIFDNPGTLTNFTLLSLFFIGIIRNNLIIATGHIGYSWALHFSWIAIMLGSSHFFSESEKALIETVRFNIYLGSPELPAILLILTITSFIYILKKNKSKIALP